MLWYLGGCRGKHSPAHTQKELSKSIQEDWRRRGIAVERHASGAPGCLLALMTRHRLSTCCCPQAMEALGLVKLPAAK